MRIKYVELAGFRGFRKPTRIDFAPGFVVLTGRNGAGKSTVLDAIDFVLTGTIDKFQNTNSKAGGLLSHIWWMGEESAAERYVRVAFSDESGREFVVSRTPDHPLAPNLDEVGAYLCSSKMGEHWERTLVETSLIRDETITKLSIDLPGQGRFEMVRAAIGSMGGPDWSTRAAAILTAAKEAKAVQDERLVKSRADLGRALSSLTEARSAADRQPDVAEAEASITRLAPDIDLSAPDVTEKMRRRLAERKQSIAILSSLVTRAEAASAEAVRLISSDEEERHKAAEFKLEELTARERVAVEELSLARSMDNAEREADRFASSMISLLNHGEEIGLIDGHCPLCDAVRSNAEFASSVAAARKRLSDGSGNSVLVRERLSRAETAMQDLTTRLDAARSEVTALRSSRERNQQELNELNRAFAALKFSADASNPDEARHQVLILQEEVAELEHALFILEASAAFDRVATLEARVETLRSQLEEEEERSTNTEKALDSAKLIDNAAKSVANQVINEQFDTVMPLLKELFKRLRPHAEWREIEPDFGGKVRATLDFTVGEGKNPQFLFSSGQRRAAGLAFLLAIHLSRPWAKLQTLMLDDPVQHIDDFRALNLVEVLTAIRKLNRQVVVAVEDPLLADLLCRRLRSTPDQGGKRYDLAVDASGSAAIENAIDIRPHPARVLDLKEVS